MDKAPDAFRTISEVADDLDIPQHVLRFWETRFAQIKPMKRSGGRRYYRPDDVDLLRGIRRLLYGEGYTIRGVQKILKEQGIKAVQALADGAPLPSVPSPRPEEARRPEAPALRDEVADDDLEHDYDEELDEATAEADDDADERREPDASHGRELPLPEPRRPPVPGASGRSEPAPRAALPAGALGAATKQRLQAVLDDLLAARELLDEALREHPGAPIPD